MDKQDFAGKIDYAPPVLPRDTFEYPRPDMMAQIISLYDLKKPIKIDYKELDDINKELFDRAAKEKKPGSFVQILTNKPRSVFYVAMITALPSAEKSEFVEAMTLAKYNERRHFMAVQMRQQGRKVDWLDLFAMRVQQQDAKQFRRQVIEDFKRAANYEGPTDEARKQFDERTGD